MNAITLNLITTYTPIQLFEQGYTYNDLKAFYSSYDVALKNNDADIINRNPKIDSVDLINSRGEYIEIYKTTPFLVDIDFSGTKNEPIGEPAETPDNQPSLDDAKKRVEEIKAEMNKSTESDFLTMLGVAIFGIGVAIAGTVVALPVTAKIVMVSALLYTTNYFVSMFFSATDSELIEYQNKLDNGEKLTVIESYKARGRLRREKFKEKTGVDFVDYLKNLLSVQLPRIIIGLIIASGLSYYLFKKRRVLK